MAQTVPLRETARYGKIARREDSEAAEVRWEHHVADLPDIEAIVERVHGMLPWTHRVSFEHGDQKQHWLLRGFSPLTHVPD